MENLEQKLSQIETAIANFTAKAAEERKSLGDAHAETKNTIANLQKQFDALVVEIKKPGKPGEEKSFREELKENESFQRLLRDKKGSATVEFKSLPDLEAKTTITSAALGSATAGVLMPQQVAGIVPGAERRLTVRDLLPKNVTAQNAVFYVKENVFTNAASPQVEANAKAESALTFTTVSTPVRTIAHWIPGTKQALDDFDGLAAYINRKLVYGLKKVEETELLSGDNTGEHLNGLITQATAFNTALLTASDGWKRGDLLREAITQVELADEAGIGFFVLNPGDWSKIERTKTTYGEYVFANPAAGMMGQNLWGRPVIVTPSIAAGTFLAGSSAQAEIFDRMGVTVEISTEHSTYFTSNMIAIRAEERLALVVYRPAAYITGTLNQSPA